MNNNGNPSPASRALIIGLDCASPDLIFDRWADDLPVLSGLAAKGVAGRLTSTIPPITVPAWTSMVTGLDPGQLGLYGFRNRPGYQTYDLRLADYNHVREPRLWDIVGRAGGKNIVLGVPLTWPPPEVNGLSVSCFLTPGEADDYTRPKDLRHKLDEWSGGRYMRDVENFRTEDKDRVLADISRMTRGRFRVVEKLLDEPWDFFMMVEMGPDRLHHGFWRYIDPSHPLHVPDSPYGEAARQYYMELDTLIGRLLDRLPPNVLVLVVSDHGARSMTGGLALNQWLVDEGLLKLKPGAHFGSLHPDMVDWPATRTWAAGGYYGRIFFNVRGRDRLGLLLPDEYDSLRRETAEKLEALTDENGRSMKNICLRPDRIYRATRGCPPDLMLFAGGLGRRTLGSLGGPLLQQGNDTGPDDANHAMDGVLIASVTGKKLSPSDSEAPYSIYQIAPTVLESLGLPVPPTMIGQPLSLHE